jgi:hypothetical protein
MNQRPSLREALARVDFAELDEESERRGRQIGQAIAVALEEHEEPATPPAPPERFKPTEDDRQRLLDEAWRDASRAMEQNRDRLGRRVTSTHDARVHRQIFELLRSMAAGPDNDPSFQ